MRRGVGPIGVRDRHGVTGNAFEIPLQLRRGEPDGFVILEDRNCYGQVVLP